MKVIKLNSPVAKLTGTHTATQTCTHLVMAPCKAMTPCTAGRHGWGAGPRTCWGAISAHGCSRHHRVMEPGGDWGFSPRSPLHTLPPHCSLHCN